MIEDSITDFRNVIEEKLKLKKDALDQTEQHLKKFSVLRENNGSSVPAPVSRERNTGNRGSVRGRLGPPANNANGRGSLESRLGPKVQEIEHDDPFQEEKRSVLSRVVVEQQKSRDEALAEEEKNMDKKEKQVCDNVNRDVSKCHFMKYSNQCEITARE